MHSVLLLGCGKIGRVIARMLSHSGSYGIRVADTDAHALQRVREELQVEVLALDASDRESLRRACGNVQSVISALSYHFNPLVAQTALEAGASYFDLTEDIETTRRVRQLAAGTSPGQVLMPQCGLAPGFISILAYQLTKSFETLDTVHMRVGALPQFPTNALNYNLTWSTDGLINEYCNACEAIHRGQRIDVLPLEGLEFFALDGVRYEAFNTSGGLGTLCETLAGQVRELNYRTIRYVGHRDLASFLINELRLGERREVLKNILEQAIPVTFQDVVVIFCTVTGWRDGQYLQVSEARKVYQMAVEGTMCSAIQITTAAGICAALDLHVAGRLPSSGFVKQEDIDFHDFMQNRFGRYYCAGNPVNSCQTCDQGEGGGSAGTSARGTESIARAS